PLRGSVAFFGSPAGPVRDGAVNERVGWVVSQEEQYPPFVSVGSFLDALGRCYRSWDAGLADRLLRRFELSPAKQLAHLSLGESSKVKLVKALAHRPELLVMDELTANLSECSKRVITETLLEEFSSRPMSVLYFCHQKSEALRLSDRV